MITDTLSSSTDIPILTNSQTQNENTSGQDEFLKQLQELQSKTDQHKHVQDQLLANRQEKIVQNHEKSDEQLDLEHDEQRKINRHGGYSVTDLRRGVDLVDAAGAAPNEGRFSGSESEMQNREKASEMKFFAEPQNSNSMLPESESEDSGKNTAQDHVEPQMREQKHQLSVTGQTVDSRQDDKTGVVSNVKQNTAIQAKVSISGMTPVINRSDATMDANLETKMAAAMKQLGEVKGKHDNTITKEAVTSTSEVASQQGKGTSHHTGKEGATSQVFPQTSLVERVDQAKLTQRITNVFRSLCNQDGTVRMKLHPEELGSITLRMKTEDGKVSANIEAETETAKTLLLDNLEQLRSKLAEQNIQLDSFEVDVRPDFQQNMNSDQGNDQEYSFQPQTRSSQHNLETNTTTDENISRSKPSLGNHSIDVIG